CVVVEDEVTFWGQVGCTSGVTIGTKAVLLAKSGISKSLEGGKSYFGVPAEDIRVKYKELAAIRQIPEVLEGLKLKK
ncbi:MAG TPA: UDP-3-O-(3-hydroxymyristoyl)glucosamine N-acyltransferase, partial [Mariniflexile sp.]|nr:UDP-3-O-(3-hydroxymyristoyl)glucosamine N-acyltransferase [Mariniflexile sp.]